MVYHVPTVGHVWESRCGTACPMQTPREGRIAVFSMRRVLLFALARQCPFPQSSVMCVSEIETDECSGCSVSTLEILTGTRCHCKECMLRRPACAAHPVVVVDVLYPELKLCNPAQQLLHFVYCCWSLENTSRWKARHADSSCEFSSACQSCACNLLIGE